MNKIYLSLFTIASLAQGEALKEVEINIDAWQGESTHSFQAVGDKIDLGEMGNIEGTSPSIAIDMKAIDKPLNLKLQYTKIDNDDTTIATSNINYNDAVIFAGQKIKTTYKADIYDMILYGDIVENKKGWDWDLGLGVRYVDNSFEIRECSRHSTTDISDIFPMLYTKVEYGFTAVDAYLKGELIYSPINTQHIDGKVALGYDISDNFDIEAGYRLLKIKPDITKIKSDVVTKGAYLGLGYTF